MVFAIRNGTIGRMSDGSKVGRPSKGPRDGVLWRAHPDVKHAAQARARACGMTLNDFLTHLVSRETSQHLSQEGLPFGEVA